MGVAGVGPDKTVCLSVRRSAVVRRTGTAAEARCAHLGGQINVGAPSFTLYTPVVTHLDRGPTTIYYPGLDSTIRSPQTTHHWRCASRRRQSRRQSRQSRRQSRQSRQSRQTTTCARERRSGHPQTASRRPDHKSSRSREASARRVPAPRPLAHVGTSGPYRVHLEENASNAPGMVAARRRARAALCARGGCARRRGSAVRHRSLPSRRGGARQRV